MTILIASHRALRVTRRDGSEHSVLYDSEDAPAVERYAWSIKPNATSGDLFYAFTKPTRPDGTRYGMSMHALLMGRAWVDHINHNGLDNRRSNLRLVTPTQNAANQRPTRGCSSPYKGVGWSKQERKWRARIRVAGRSIFLGCFHDEIAAAEAYNRAAVEAFGEFAYLNPIAAETRKP